MSESRFAIYFAPEDDTALARFGWNWLGRSPHSALDLPLPDLGVDSAVQASWIAEPRPYGFHATLKPPFRLKDAFSRNDLMDALTHFAAERRGFRVAPFLIEELNGFLAFRPSRAEPELDELAADCVRDFDHFRAPLSANELTRRRAAGLTWRQERMLEYWGYPYVMEEFRFHMTLTGKLAQPDRSDCLRVLSACGCQLGADAIEVRSISLFEQTEPDARFLHTERIAFGPGHNPGRK